MSIEVNGKGNNKPYHRQEEEYFCCSQRTFLAQLHPKEWILKEIDCNCANNSVRGNSKELMRAISIYPILFDYFQYEIKIVLTRLNDLHNCFDSLQNLFHWHFLTNYQKKSENIFGLHKQGIFANSILDK